MKKPWQTTLSGQEVGLFPEEQSLEEFHQTYPKAVLRLGVVAVFMYRNFPDMDNLRAFFAGEEVVTYDQTELATWVGGLALTKERQHILRLAERQNKSFEQQQGWRPAVLLKDNPNRREQDEYSRYQAALIDQEWLESGRTETEDDGA